MSSDRPPRPDPLAVDREAVPEDLRDRDRWICWRYEFDDDRDEWTKIPVDVATGGYASATDPDTWTTFGDAVAYHDRNDRDTDGLGFVFSSGDTVLGIDLDDCRDPKTGELAGWAGRVLAAVDSYAEASPSGTGVHVYAHANLPDGGNRADVDDAEGHLELYDRDRYFTVTGQQIEAAPTEVRPANDAVRELHAEYILDEDDAEDETDDDAGATSTADVDLEDRELLRRAKNAENGKKFTRLWNGRTAGYESHSEADLALCGLLAFWTGGDRERMDDLFRESGLMRDKWDADRGDRTYGERTLDKALEGRTEFYDPGRATDTTTPPADAVDSALIDALLEAPGEWLDPDTREWTVRATEDHDAEAIADALRDGELPGDADGALADAVLSGDVPDEIGAALKEWRQEPSTWSVEVERSFDPATLAPEAIADAAGVPVDELGDLPARERAHHVWHRVGKGDHRIIARMGEHADGALFAFDEDAGTWRETGADELRTLGHEALGAAYSKRVGGELEERVRVTRAPGEPRGQVHIDEFGAPAETLPATNGLLDIVDGELRPLKPTDYALSTLPVAYDPDADCPRFQEYLEEVCPRSVDRKKLQEYTGYTLMHWGLPHHKALFVAGPQASGKSTFLEVVEALLGEDATCSLAPQEITGERFAGYDLFDSWANIRSDIPADLIENTGKFKEVTAGDPVKIEKKYEDPITVRPTTKHLFAANTLPSAEIEDDAFFRRILLVSFPRTIPRDDRDPQLDERLRAELPGILNWALEGLDRLRDQGHFSGDLPPAETQEKWDVWGNSIDRFKQRCLDTDTGADEYVPKREVYAAYQRFCESEGIPVESRQKFGRELKKDSSIGDARRTVDGDPDTYVYTGVELMEARVPASGHTDDDSDQWRFSG